MRIAEQWKDYKLLDASGGERLEQWKDVVLIRPDPQIIWNTPKNHPLWNRADAQYHRSAKGGGEWEFFHRPVQARELNYRDLCFKVQPTNFKHMGLFPEQAVNWDFFSNLIRSANRPISVLNLFAYTGGATLAAARSGATVCHLDASKGMVRWARENATLSGLQKAPVCWIVDDCEKFVTREIKRGRRYDAVIMDPPSYGRGPGGELWKLEETLFHLSQLCENLLSDAPLFFALNSYTTGLSAATMKYLLGVTIGHHFSSLSADEIGLLVEASGQALPCGSTALCLNENPDSKEVKG